MPAIHEPTAQILHTCDLVTKGIQQFQLSMNDKSILEGILDLAQKDLAFIQAGMILTRSLFEGLIRTSWVLHSSDQFENESRYVGLLDTECEFSRRWIKEMDTTDSSDGQRRKKSYEAICSFRDDFIKALGEKGYSPQKLPNVRNILRLLNEERKYVYYMLLSHYTHLTHTAGNIYRENLGVYKEMNDSPQIDKWKLVFVISWPVFELATELFILRISGESLYSDEFKKEVRDSLLAIA